MKTVPLIKALLTFAAVAVIAAGSLWMWPTPAAGQEAFSEWPPAGGGKYEFEPSDEITPEQRRQIQEQIRANIERLTAEGRLPAARPEAVPLSWPVRKAPGFNIYDVDAISNFVDHNPAFPNMLLDWNCGNRTYDLSGGYNHAGIDIFTWPFSWSMMDNNQAEVIAAAPGTIIFKSDGNFDRNCGFGSGQWNAVYVRHADNSVAWYGHMKSGSVTTKPIGATVETGERLGVIGSSGSSTGPHLHFELYNSSSQLQDPYQGPCNMMNSVGWWANQPAYRVSRVNRLMTQSAAPVFPACPTTETTNQKDRFLPGENIVTAIYYRDQMGGQQTQYSLRRPDGSVAQSWSHSSPQTYSASFWWWQWTLPANAPRGTWTFRAVYNGQTYEHNFRVGQPGRFDYDGDGRSDVSVFRPQTGGWYIDPSSDPDPGIEFQSLGLPTDKLAPADYDGDGKTDVAVFRPSNGDWYIIQSSNQAVRFERWGGPGDVPVPGDFDGDGRADLGVFRAAAGQWWIQLSGGGFINGFLWGQPGDLPLVGKFDNDAKDDIAIYRPDANIPGAPNTSAWIWSRSSDGQGSGVGFGRPADRIAPGDYDGDGLMDVAVMRPDGNEIGVPVWYILRSSSGYTPAGVYYEVWGSSTDIPVPGDYDGDGRDDPAIWRSATGEWWILKSTGGFTNPALGQVGDVPTVRAFIATE